ncbi:MAG: serine--tRNA ligase [Rhodobacteraceae bacterium]|nr:serine--tRNA ligase [Paracoccaceae bacterium]
MHDIQQIRDNPTEFDRNLRRRGEIAHAKELIRMDSERRAAISKSEQALAERNRLSKQAGEARARGNQAEFEQVRLLVVENRETIGQLGEQADALSDRLHNKLLEIPNLPMSDVPDGEDETTNQEMRRNGQIPAFDFMPKEHFEIKAAAGMDLATASTLSGPRFMVLRGDLARLHRVLAQFMIDLHTEEHGLTEVWAPVLVHDEMMRGTGQLPKFEADSYRLEDGKWLIPTAEVTLTNLINNTIINEDSLPHRYCSHTQCFRSEAGAAGKDTAGMLRQHQFEKVEMVSVTRPEDSEEEQQRMVRQAETVLERLDLPYRTVLLCTGDMGFSARRTFDLEVWLPGQNRYREISSVSTCGDFQSRRMNARYRPTDGGALRFPHTLNGSGVAVGRTLIAVLENGQQRDGSVALPVALHPYLHGKTHLSDTGQLTM